MPIYSGNEIGYNLFDLGFDKGLVKDTFLLEDDLGITPELAHSILSAISPEIILSGELNAELSSVTGYLQSGNFVTGSSGWRINSDGDVEFNTGVFRGSVEVGSIHIPDQDTTANSFHVDGDGNAWWGATETDFNSNNDNATSYVLKTGVAKFQDVTVVGAIQAGAGSNVANLYTYDEFVAGENITSGDGVYQLYVQEFDNYGAEDTNYVNDDFPTQTFNNTVSITVSVSPSAQIGYIQFDISSLPDVVSGAERVILNFKIHSEPGGGNSSVFTISRVTASWDPTTLTWNNKPATTGNYGTFLVEDGNTGWKEVDITTLYNEWKSGAENNYGITITGSSSNTWKFWGGAGVDKPYLKVDSRLAGGDADIGKVYKAKADTGRTCGTFRGIAVETITAGNTIKIQTSGVMTSSDLAGGPGSGVIYPSDTNAGLFVTVAPAFPLAVGKIIGTKFYFDVQQYIRKTFTGKLITGFTPLSVFPTITDPTVPTIIYRNGSVEVDTNVEYMVMGI